MKKKFDEIENESYLLKYINLNKSTFAIMQQKNNSKITIAFDYSSLSNGFKNEKCEIIVESSKKILLRNKNQNSSNKIHIESTTENIINSAYVKSLTNGFLSFNAIKFNIITYINFAVAYRKNYFKSILNSLPNENKIIAYEKSIEKYKIDLYNDAQSKYNDYITLGDSVDKLISDTKAEISVLVNNVLSKKPCFNFELKSNIKGQHYLSRTNEFFYYQSKVLKTKITYGTNLVIHINYVQLNKNVFITWNNQNDFIFECVDDFMLVFKPNIIFFGFISSKAENYFGIEKTSKYLYIGNYLNDNFNDIGVLICNTYIYRGRFSKSNKKDKNCVIYLEKGKTQYIGGIDGNEIKGKGEYSNSEKIIRGDFISGGELLNGKCEFLFNNGDEYIGDMRKGIKVGTWRYKNKKTGMEMTAKFSNEEGKNEGIIYNF